jgi:hypothetical protein
VGLIYLWVLDGIIPPLYTIIDLSDGNRAPVLVDRISPEDMVKDGRKTIAVAFAPYSPIVAFLTITNESADLWIADINLHQVEHIWSNNQQWVGQFLTPGDAYIQWGPNEKSIVLSSHLVKGQIVVYSLTSKEVVEGLGTCDQIAPLPESDSLTVWCSFETGFNSPYGALSYDGNILPSKFLPEDSQEVYDWSFAPGNNRVVYVPPKGNAVIVNDIGNRIALPIRFLNTPREYMTQSYLQWSVDGDRLLTYAFNREHCPLVEDPAFGNLIEEECWLVLDAKTGNFLWWPDESREKIIEATGIPLEELSSNCAGLSPDGDWIALCTFSGAINDFLLISIKSNIVIDFGSFDTLNFKWLRR